MDVAKGILTAVGGKSSHAAVVARGMGRPCIVGAGSIAIDEHGKKFTVTVNKQDHHRQGRRLDFDRRHHGEGLPRQGRHQGARSDLLVLRQADDVGR